MLKSGLTVNKFVSKKKFSLDKDFLQKFFRIFKKRCKNHLNKFEISISINKQTYSLNKPFDVLELNILEDKKEDVILKE